MSYIGERPDYIYITRQCTYYFNTRRVSNIDTNLVMLHGRSHVLNVTENNSFILEDLKLCKNRLHVVQQYYK